MQRSLAFALVLCLFAGCASSSDSTSGSSSHGATSGVASSGPTGGHGTTGAPTSAPTSGPTSGPSSGHANHPPVPHLALTVAAGAAPLATNVTATATDADNDTVTGTLSYGDGSANVTLPKLPATFAHSFAAAGNYTLTLTVSDGKQGASTTAQVTVTGGGSASLAVTDPSGDAHSDYTDILTVDPSHAGGALTVVVGLKSVWPVGEGFSPVGYDLNIDGNDFRCYAYQTGVLLWDNTAAAYVGSSDGSCTWDTTANTVTFTLTDAYLAPTDSLKAPYKVFVASFEGGLADNLAAAFHDLADDLAPDTGAILVP